jgi:hypothetical protein
MWSHCPWPAKCCFIPTYLDRFAAEERAEKTSPGLFAEVGRPLPRL